MNQNHIESQWRQCHWKEWREIRARWNQLRKSREAHDRQSRVRAAELERRGGRSVQSLQVASLRASALGLADIRPALRFAQKTHEPDSAWSSLVSVAERHA
jgi:hypothetical protein